MKKSSTKASGLLGDLSFQQVAPISSDGVTGCQTKPEDATGNPMMAEDAAGNQMIADDGTSNHKKAQEATRKPGKLKEAKHIQTLIEQGNDQQAMIESGVVKRTFKMPEKHQGVRGAGRRVRMSVPMTEEIRDYISREARKHGMTNAEYIYSLASAAASGMIRLEDFLDES